MDIEQLAPQIEFYHKLGMYDILDKFTDDRVYNNSKYSDPPYMVIIPDYLDKDDRVYSHRYRYLDTLRRCSPYRPRYECTYVDSGISTATNTFIG